MTLSRTSTNLLAALGALTLGAGMLVGCTPKPVPIPTPTAAFTSEEEAFAAAEEVYRAYNDAFNAVDLQDPTTFEPVFKFTTGEYQESEREDLSAMHAEGYVRGGAIEIINFVPAKASEESIVARTCNDVSSTTFTDSKGVNLVPADRPNRVALDLTFIVKGGKPLLSEAQVVEDDSCALG